MPRAFAAVTASSMSPPTLSLALISCAAINSLLKIITGWRPSISP
jgi:hypothetical protein